MQEMDAIVRRIDTNSDYVVTLTEFIDLFRPRMPTSDDIFADEREERRSPD